MADKLRRQVLVLMRHYIGDREGTRTPIPMYEYKIVGSFEEAFQLVAEGHWCRMDELPTGRLEPVPRKAKKPAADELPPTRFEREEVI